MFKPANPKPALRFQIIQASAIALFLGLGIAAVPLAGAQETGEQAPADPGFSTDFSDVAPADEADPAQVENTPDAAPETTQEPSADMLAKLDQMGEVIAALDGEAERTGNNWQFMLDERMMLVVTDTGQGRMRVITPIAPVDALPEGALQRLMQANFDTALDARYAVAQDLVWGAFIHPLDTLTTRDFASGILQTHSLAQTFGTTFSSGALNYGGGDSGAIIDEQLQELLEQLDNRETT